VSVAAGTLRSRSWVVLSRLVPATRDVRTAARSRARRRDERGASAVELVLYMPLLMIIILLAVQFALVYLGGQVASGAAREGARAARVSSDAARGHQVAQDLVDDIGAGVLEDARIEVQVGAENARVTVSGHAEKVLWFLPIPDVNETVVGPLERFVPDAGAAVAP
jgi:hypothetical protein